MNSGKVGVALAIALGILIIYIAAIGNAKQLLSLFSGSSSSGGTGSNAGTLSGTSGSAAAQNTSNTANAGAAAAPASTATAAQNISVGSYASAPAVTNGALSGVLAGSSLGGANAFSTITPESILSTTNSELANAVGTFNYGSMAGLTGGISGLGAYGSSPTYGNTPTTVADPTTPVGGAFEASPTSVIGAGAYTN